MPKLILALFLLLAGALISPVMKASEAPAPIPTLEARYTHKRSQRHDLPYLITLPEGYSKSARKKWPLLVFLHGAGERGNQLKLVTMHGPPQLARQGNPLPFIVVSPQCPLDQVWDDEAVLGLIEHLLVRHQADPKRVYLTGLSMGGFGTWSLASRHPERFAAVVPICGGGDTIPLLLASKEKKASLRKLGVWAFHGAKDSVVPLAESERMIQSFKRAGHPDAKLTVYSEADHKSWTEAYNNPEIYRWMLGFHR